MLAIVFNSVLKVSYLICFGCLGVHDWHLDFDGIIVVLEVHCELVIHLKILSLWVL